MTTINVWLVSRQRLVRDGLRILIERDLRLRVVCEAEACAALETSSEARPDVLVLDHDFDDERADVAAAARLAPRLLVLTASADPEVGVRAVRLGAAGLVTTDQPAHVLRKAIEKVHDGEAWFDRTTVAAIFSNVSDANVRSDRAPEAAGVGDLTKREREILTLATEGLKTRIMADRLCISEATVRHHLTSIFGKLGVADRVGLIVFANRAGLMGIRQ